MARSPNSRPDKGFIREIERNPKLVEKKQPFNYSKPVTPQSKEVNGMHTPHRMREFKSVKQTSDFTTETANHIKKRRGE